MAEFRREQRVDLIVTTGRLLLSRQPSADQQAEIISRMAEVQIQSGAYGYADSLLNILITENKTPFGIAHAFKQKSLLHSYQSQFTEAFFYIGEALKAVRKTNDRYLNAYLQVDLMELCRRAGKLDDSKLYAQKIETYISENGINSDAFLARFLNRQAAIWNEAGNGITSPVKLSLQALYHAKKCGDLHLQAVSCDELGFCYKNLHKSQLSYEYYTRAIENWTSTHRYQDAAYAFHNRIVMQFHNHTQDPKKGIAACFELLDYIQQHKVDFPVYKIYNDLASTYNNELKDYKKAYEYRTLANREELGLVVRTKEHEFSELSEKYKADLLKEQVALTESKLDSSTRKLKYERKQAETFIVAAIAIASLLIIVFILLLWTRQSRNKIAAQSQEKDFLIKEIHHRVKNNLAMISSLLEMHTTSSKSPLDQQTMSEITARISSMSLVHEMLYTTSNEDFIDLNHYIRNLIQLLYDTIEADVDVQFEGSAHEIIVKPRQSLALGILLSEMYINAAKYAFNEVDNPIFVIRLSKFENDIQLTVSDNGPGSSSENRIKGLGTRLIDIFSRQLDGTCTLDTSGGYTYNITFKQ